MQRSGGWHSPIRDRSSRDAGDYTDARFRAERYAFAPFRGPEPGDPAPKREGRDEGAREERGEDRRPRPARA